MRRLVTKRVQFPAAISAILAVVIGGCAALHVPDNAGDPYAPEQSGRRGVLAIPDARTPLYQASMCPPPGTSGFIMPAALVRRKRPSNLMTMRYSTGDRFNLQVPGSPELSGDYVVNADGRVMLPFAEPVLAIGLTNDALARGVERAMLRARLFQPEGFRVSARPVLYAAINITVSGAVFMPGRYTINNRDPDKLSAAALAKSGDSPVDRFLATALKAAGGVRPDADLSRVVLVRDGRRHRLDWRGALSGAPVDDVALLEGDHVHVEEAACFQSALVRPSQITIPGIRVFVSNLTVPATSNASANVNHHATSLPYGTRFLQGLVSANCVGGSLATNARRHGVLISRNPRSGETQVVQRSIEDLVLSADRDTINPYLMPDDAIACYDSAVTDAREVSSLINALLTPFNTVASTAALWTAAKTR